MMKKGPAESQVPDPLKNLLSMPLEERIVAVGRDVRDKTDEFRKIDPHKLAEALGVPSTKQPNCDDWAFTHYARKQSLEEYADEYGCLSDCLSMIKGKVPVPLFESLLEKSSALDELQLDFLTDEERREFEQALAFEQLKSNMENGICSVAHFSVTLAEHELEFEVDIEDDGSCIDLRTPYDHRDGKFVSLDDCVTDSQLRAKGFRRR
jgi:hypothetical protein